MLQSVVEKLEEIPENLREHYKQTEGGKFAIELAGLEDGSEHPSVKALVNAKKRVADEKGKAEAAAKEQRERAEALVAERDTLLKLTVPKDNFERLEKSYQDRGAAEKKELIDKYTAELARVEGSLKELLVDNVANKLAHEMADKDVHAPLFLPFLKSRLAYETTSEGKATTRVLDSDGKPSAATLEDLKKEILAMPMFSEVALGSKATGGGAQGGSGGGGAPQSIDLSKASLAEKEAYYRAKNHQQ